MANISIDRVWPKIVAHAGEDFHQKRGKVFTYTTGHGGARPSTTNQFLPRNQFEKALARMPTEGPGALQDLRGPSYLWAILMDDRIRRRDW